MNMDEVECVSCGEHAILLDREITIVFIGLDDHAPRGPITNCETCGYVVAVDMNG